ncbi:HPr-rel-A system PqqD family peptide chaperone [Massilia luteola]|jgi:PqqD family protein of HPr-rel-A system|uniref:HPr-rel-A system PqqD family peptide chaperone n=1 Tax=Massilia luteola TaxID=3081751 RepID=UPI002ACC1814|nr:HPr-rel-A system PqqD family peptide chaperone [Massilia sp. Gc5]
MWRLTPGQALACREWDGEAVLYNDLSGSTHLLDGAALDLLLALRDEPADAATLAGRLAERFDAGDDDLVSLIDEMLAALAGLDLIEPC